MLEERSFACQAKRSQGARIMEKIVQKQNLNICTLMIIFLATVILSIWHQLPNDDAKKPDTNSFKYPGPLLQIILLKVIFLNFLHCFLLSFQLSVQEVRRI